MKPSEVNAIIVFRKNDDIEFIEVVEAGEKLRSEVLSWALMWCLDKKINIQYSIDGGVNKIGSPKFLKSEK